MAPADHRGRAARGPWRAVIAGLVVLGLTGACRPEAVEPPSVQGRAVATYSDPSVYRVGAKELRRLIDGMEPDSPQRAMLADGRVSRAEVDQAWKGYAQCVRGAGFDVTTSAWDPVTSTTRVFTVARAGAPTSARTAPPTASPTGEAMTSEEDEQVDACDERYWFPVAAIYTADTPARMAPELAAAMQACMARRGYAVQGVTDFGGMVGAVRGQARGERVQAGRDCLATALPALYPDLPYYPRP